MPDLWNHAVVTTGRAIQVGPTADQRDQLMQMIARFLIQVKTGL